MKKYLFFAGIIILLVGGIWLYSAKSKRSTFNGKLDVSENGFSISQQGNTLKQQYIQEASGLDLGISIYPGAELIEEQGAASNLEFNGKKIIAATYKTSDSRERVERYFMNQIGSEAVTVEAINGDKTYRVVKSKTNTGTLVNIWNEEDTIYFTVIKPLDK